MNSSICMATFTESQRFRQKWVWILMGFISLIVIGSLSVAGEWNDPGIWSGIVVLIGIIILLYVWRLDTRLDSTGVHYRVFPVFAWRTIPWSRVKSALVCQYDFVGYGIRWDFNGWIYNIVGDKGMRVVLTNGRRITIGTQRPEEIQHFLDQQIVPIV